MWKTHIDRTHIVDARREGKSFAWATRNSPIPISPLGTPGLAVAAIQKTEGKKHWVPRWAKHLVDSLSIWTCAKLSRSTYETLAPFLPVRTHREAEKLQSLDGTTGFGENPMRGGPGPWIHAVDEV